MFTNHTAYKNETPYKGAFVIAQFLTNGTVMLQYGVTQIQYNIGRIRPNELDTKVEYLNLKICLTMSTYVNILDMKVMTSDIVLF